MSTWLLRRIQTLSVKEIGYRVAQITRRMVDKRAIGKADALPKGEVSFTQLLFIPAGDLPPRQMSCDVFNKIVQLDPIPDWHFDPYSGQEFDRQYSFNQSPRHHGDKCVKHTWEVNRFQFIVNWALHYSETKDERILDDIVRVVDNWLIENPYLTGVNWYSGLEISIRALNWWLALSLIDVSKPDKLPAYFVDFYKTRWLPSIYRHGTHLANHLSQHSSANNHLIGELCGLFVLSTVWSFPESSSWSKKSSALLNKEIAKQHDGGVNREQASEYIQFITEFLLTAFIVDKRSRQSLSESYEKALREILEYIDQLTFADGRAIFYGDADDGHVFKIGDESSFLDRLVTGYALFDKPEFGIKPKRFGTTNRIVFGDAAKRAFDTRSIHENDPETKVYDNQGHTFFRNEEGIVAHFNAAPLGYLSTAAHGHADALSFALFANGTPILVDPGTYSYHKEPEVRNYFKSTAAHNTIEIDGENQAKNAAPMIWLKHYSCKIEEVAIGNDLQRVAASHNGYASLGCHHRRVVEFQPDLNRFKLVDVLTSTNDEEHQAVLRFHLHPDLLDINEVKTGYTCRTVSGTIVSVNIDKVLECRLVKGWYSDAFYTKQDSLVIEGRVTFQTHLELTTIIEVSHVSS